MQPDVLDGESELLKQSENQLQLGINERFAGDSTVKNRNAHDRFPVQNRHCYLAAEQFELFARFGIRSHLFTVSTQDTAQSKEMSANPSVQREFEMFQQSG